VSDPIETRIRAYLDSVHGALGQEADSLAAQMSRRLREEEIAEPTARRLATLYPGLDRMRVLEVGSGTGGNSVALALLGASVAGVEPSFEGVATARVRAARYPQVRARFHVGVGERLPFAGGSFDLAVSFAVFEHVQDQSRVAREVFRVLRPGGRIHFEMPNYLFPREEHYQIWYPPVCPKPLGKLYVRLLGRDPQFLDTLTYTTPGRAGRTLREAGFVDVRDLFRDRSLARIDDPSLIRNPRLSRWLARLRRWGLTAPIRFVIGRGLYPESHMEGRRP